MYVVWRNVEVGDVVFGVLVDVDGDCLVFNVLAVEVG